MNFLCKLFEEIFFALLSSFIFYFFVVILPKCKKRKNHLDLFIKRYESYKRNVLEQVLEYLRETGDINKKDNPYKMAKEVDIYDPKSIQQILTQTRLDALKNIKDIKRYKCMLHELEFANKEMIRNIHRIQDLDVITTNCTLIIRLEGQLKILYQFDNIMYYHDEPYPDEYFSEKLFYNWIQNALFYFNKNGFCKDDLPDLLQKAYCKTTRLKVYFERESNLG